MKRTLVLTALPMVTRRSVRRRNLEVFVNLQDAADTRGVTGESSPWICLPLDRFDTLGTANDRFVDETRRLRTRQCLRLINGPTGHQEGAQHGEVEGAVTVRDNAMQHNATRYSMIHSTIRCNMTTIRNNTI